MQIVIHGINHQEKTSKDGKPYLRCGIKYRGKWYSGFGDDETQQWEVGNMVEVDLWEEEGKPDENGDVKVYGNFIKLTQPKSRPTVTGTPRHPDVQTQAVDASTIPGINPETDLPF